MARISYLWLSSAWDRSEETNSFLQALNRRYNELLQPFTLAAQFDAPSVAPGNSAQLTVTVTRTSGFTGEVELSVEGLPPNVQANLTIVAADQTTVTGQLDVGPAATMGRHPITVIGKATHQDRDCTFKAPPEPLDIAYAGPVTKVQPAGEGR
jgi:hypothetical protein